MFYKGNLQTTETELPIELNNDSVKRWEHEMFWAQLEEGSNKPDLD